jgi:hypothetical protein
MLEACGRYIQFWSRNVKGGDHLGDHDIYQRIILKIDRIENMMGQWGLDSCGA